MCGLILTKGSASKSVRSSCEVCEDLSPHVSRLTEDSSSLRRSLITRTLRNVWQIELSSYVPAEDRTAVKGGKGGGGFCIICKKDITPSTAWKREAGKRKRQTIFFERPIVSQTKHWICFKGIVGETSEGLFGAHMGFSELTYTILN